MPFNRIFYQLLVVMLLMSQSATLVHGVEHDYDDHTELCQAYVSAENISAIDCVAPMFAIHGLFNLAVDSFQRSLVAASFTPFHSRAPPLI